MKNSKLRAFFFSLILLASISSYLYINSVRGGDCTAKCEQKQELIDEQGSAELPDVKLLKKIIEKGRELMPATQL